MSRRSLPQFPVVEAQSDRGVERASHHDSARLSSAAASTSRLGLSWRERVRSKADYLRARRARAREREVCAPSQRSQTPERGRLSITRPFPSTSLTRGVDKQGTEPEWAGEGSRPQARRSSRAGARRSIRPSLAPTAQARTLLSSCTSMSPFDCSTCTLSCSR